MFGHKHEASNYVFVEKNKLEDICNATLANIIKERALRKQDYLNGVMKSRNKRRAKWTFLGVKPLTLEQVEYDEIHCRCGDVFCISELFWIENAGDDVERMAKNVLKSLQVSSKDDVAMSCSDLSKLVCWSK